LSQAIHRATELHRQGKLDQAEVIYTAILAKKPRHFDALHQFGMLRCQQGRNAEALDYMRAALNLNPKSVSVLSNIGLVHANLNHPEEALASYDRALALKPDLAEAHNNRAMVLIGLRRAAEALASCDRALALKPGYTEAFQNRGNALMALGRSEEALASFDRSLALRGDNVEALCNRGAVLYDLGRFAEAVTSYDHALARRPNFAEAWFNRGNALAALTRAADALASYDRALALRPGYAEACNNHGLALAAVGRPAEALASYDRALALRPGYAEAFCNRGIALADLERPDEALASYDQALALRPDDANGFNNRGGALMGLGRAEEALKSYDRALALEPDNADAFGNRGNALVELKRLDEALASYDRALAIKPDNAEALGSRAVALTELGRLAEAVAACRQALLVKPDLAVARHNLGVALFEQGKCYEAIAAYRQAIALKPSYVDAGSNLLLCLNYDERTSAAEVLRDHREWEARHAGMLPRPLVYANDRSPGRRLKVGYVSADFRQHSVAKFLEPLLRAHNRHEIEVVCYADVARPDAVTERFRALADRWIDTAGMSDAALAERISLGGIDILVDLAGHTAKNRLLVFARKPAPVQVAWLGYPNTTGLTAIDYRLVDAVTDPAPDSDAFASETLIRLTGGFLCYGAPGDAPAPTAPPCLANGAVTFGSFNNPAKLSANTLDAWATLLARLPQARLLVKGKAFVDAAARAALLDGLRQRGVAAERVEVVAWRSDWAAHIALYERVDIALDPFPYNGTTTTCEALWMAVPVVTLLGDRHAGRVGASLMTQLGLSELIAGSVEAYVETAVALAADPARLTNFRASLRPRMAASTLCDATAFARKIEAAYRAMWQNWCAAPARAAGDALVPENRDRPLHRIGHAGGSESPSGC
jgi:protein O-GlcNAc transferase